MRTKNKIEKKCYRSHAFFVDKTSVLKFESSQGDPVYFLPHKNNEQQVRAPANVYLFNQYIIAILKTITTNGYQMSVGYKVTSPGGEIDYTLLGGFMVARDWVFCRFLAGSCESRPHTFPWARKLT